MGGLGGAGGAGGNLGERHAAYAERSSSGLGSPRGYTVALAASDILRGIDLELHPGELTGLIGAVALMRPSKSVSDLELKSVKKKFKALNFAAGCSREVISSGAEMLGWPLDDLISRTIEAMRSLTGTMEI